MVINTAIIDDEKNNIDYLYDSLSAHCREVNVVGSASCKDSAISLIIKKRPDIVFLDIKMGNTTGFDILEALPSMDFEVIFVTAFEEYALRAIKFCALDYLLKPLDVDELKSAVEKTKSCLFEKKTNLRLKELISNNTSANKRIAIPDGESIKFVAVSDIVRCKGENNYTHIILENGKDILVSKTLKEYELMLVDFGFIRVHRSHLVNTAKVTAYRKRDTGYLHTIDNAEIPVSRKYKHQLMDLLETF